MKSLMIGRLTRRVVSLFLVMVVSATFSMVSLASSNKPVGELMVSGTATDGSSVTVNGEPARGGRTLFANSTITTPEGVDAIVSLGRFGKLQLAPGTTFTLSDDPQSAGGDLTSGKVTVLSAPSKLNVRTLAGSTLSLGSGESATAASSSAAQQGTGPGGLEWWKWGVIAGAVATVIIVAVVATRDDDSAPISPIR